MFASFKKFFGGEEAPPAAAGSTGAPAAAPTSTAGATSTSSSSGGGLFSFGSKVAYKNQETVRSRSDIDHLFKLLIIGDSGVGKSCFIMRFADESYFCESYISTIGVDFKIKTVDINGHVVKLQLWDTSGQERFRTITSSYYRGAHGVLVAYSVDDPRSFENVKTWLNEVERYCSENTAAILLGMKSDLPKHAVDTETAKALAEDYGMPFFEVSSKLDLNVTEAVLALCEKIGEKKGLGLGTINLSSYKPVAAPKKVAADVDDADAEVIAEDELDSSLRSAKSSSSTAGGKGKAKAGMKVKKTDVNVFRLGLESLKDKAELMTGDPIICMRCGSMLSSKSHISHMKPSAARKQTEDTKLGPSFTPAPPIHERYRKASWVSGAAAAPSTGGDSSSSEQEAEEERSYWCCEFCGAANEVEEAEVELLLQPKPCMDYLIRPPPETGAVPSNIVFVIDVSGSMSVTMEVEGDKEFKGSAARTARDKEALSGMDVSGLQRLPRERRGVTHVSRLQCLQVAIEEQIRRVARETPEKRVGLIAFSNEVKILGDGTQDPLYIAGDRLTNWATLLELGSKYKLEKSVKESQDALIKRLWELEEEGATALGPAMLAGISMAGTSPGSSVILCTDGLANQGLGSLETTDKKEFVAFYTECGEQAVLRGVTVSILSLQGTACKVENLSVVAEKTSGTVERVDPRTVMNEMGAIVGGPASIAYGAMAMVLLHRGLKFRGEMDDESEQRLWVVKDLGNITAASQCSFSYSFRPKEEVDVSNLKEVPFQVQIIYTRPDGAMYLRVATASVQLTENRDEAEKAANAEIIGDHAVQQAAKLAKQGKYEEAQLETRAAQRFMERAGVDKELLTQYVDQTECLDSVVRSERKKEKKGASARDRLEMRSDDSAAVISKAVMFKKK